MDVLRHLERARRILGGGQDPGAALGEEGNGVEQEEHLGCAQDVLAYAARIAKFTKQDPRQREQGPWPAEEEMRRGCLAQQGRQ